MQLLLLDGIAEYAHRSGCSVTGCFVYRGSSAPSAVGRYFYGDYCSGIVWSLRVEDGNCPSVLAAIEVDQQARHDVTSGGRRSAQGCAVSKAAAARSTPASSRQRPAICSPTGRPDFVKPAGTEIAGRPTTVNA